MLPTLRVVMATSLACAAIVAVSDRVSTRAMPYPAVNPAEAWLGAAPSATELTGSRTRTSNSFRMPDGTTLTRLHSESVNYRDASGRWQPVDNSLAFDGTTIHNRANHYALTLPTSLGSGSISVAEGDDWISFAPRDATHAAVVVGGSAATYLGAFDHANLTYTARADSF